MFFITTRHDAEKYTEVYHRSILVRTEEEAVFIAGDALLQAEDIERIKETICKTIHTVILNPYQAVSPEGKQMIREMNSRKFLIYHIPEKKIDGNHCTDHNAFRMAAKSVCRSWPSALPQPVLLMQMTYADAVNA